MDNEVSVDVREVGWVDGASILTAISCHSDLIILNNMNGSSNIEIFQLF